MSDPTRPDGHRRYRELLGAHAAGQLQDTEAAELEHHLEDCASCRAEAAELRATVGLFLSAEPSMHDLQRAALDPSPDLEDRIVAAVLPERANADGPNRAIAERRFGTRGRFAVVLAATALLLAAGLSLATVLSTPQGPPGLGEVEPIAFSEAPKGVSTDAAVVAHTWGTEVDLQVEGLLAGEVYTVLVEKNTGELVPAGTFVAVEAKPVECRLNGAVLRQNARSVIVEDSTGEVVMRSELKPRPDLASSGLSSYKA